MSRLRIPVNDNDHTRGNRDSQIQLVEYGDFECPNCGHAHPLVKRLLKEFEGQFLFVFRHFPLQQRHPMALLAALAAEAAAKQDKFWEMHDLIYNDQKDLNADNLLYYAQSIGLNLSQFGKDWDDADLQEHIEQDMESGIRSGVNGTPTFFLSGNRLETYDESYESLAGPLRNVLSE